MKSLTFHEKTSTAFRHYLSSDECALLVLVQVAGLSGLSKVALVRQVQQYNLTYSGPKL